MASFGTDVGPRWCEHLGKGGKAALQLFCFPYAGGSADVYRSWQRSLAPDCDLCLVHLPGRGRNIREQAFTSLGPLVQVLANCIREEAAGQPYALYGHSMGALIAFELARVLSQRGIRGPEHVFVSGRSASDWPRKSQPIFGLPQDEFISALRKLNGTQPEVLDDPAVFSLFVNVMRADFELADTYQFCPREPLACPITAYGGLDDEHVPVESCYAWRKHTVATCRVRMFAGNHFFIRNPGSEFINALRNDVLSAVPTAQ